jgi:hypothetical protein
MRPGFLGRGAVAKVSQRFSDRRELLNRSGGDQGRAGKRIDVCSIDLIWREVSNAGGADRFTGPVDVRGAGISADRLFGA